MVRAPTVPGVPTKSCDRCHRPVPAAAWHASSRGMLMALRPASNDIGETSAKAVRTKAKGNGKELLARE